MIQVHLLGLEGESNSILARLVFMATCALGVERVAVVRGNGQLDQDSIYFSHLFVIMHSNYGRVNESMEYFI